jgi:hypothetical protein
MFSAFALRAFVQILLSGAALDAAAPARPFDARFLPPVLAQSAFEREKFT